MRDTIQAEILLKADLAFFVEVQTGSNVWDSFEVKTYFDCLLCVCITRPTAYNFVTRKQLSDWNFHSA